jgi:hypothetical protein
MHPLAYTAGTMTLLRLGVILLLTVGPAVRSAVGQEHVSSTVDDFSLPAISSDAIPDADLRPALRYFNGQHSVDGIHPPGMTDRMLPVSLGHISGRGPVQPIVVEGVVLRSDAYLTPDRTGVATVITVLPSAILQMPANYPSGAIPGPRRGQQPPAGANQQGPPQTPSTLRFVLAGGAIYFDENNGLAVQQSGVNYPGAGDSLVFFGETLPQDNSATLILTGACALMDGHCVSIDGNPTLSDALTARLPGGLATAEAFSMVGAPVADATDEGVRGLAQQLEGRYNLGIGDVRRLAGPEIPMLRQYTPASLYETVVRAQVLNTEATLTVGGGSIVSHSVVSVEQVLASPEGGPRARTMEVTERGGFLRASEDEVMAAFTPAQMPLVAGGDYYLALGLTSDNRWELRASWRIVGDEVFAMDRLRTAARTRSQGSYWQTTEDFLQASTQRFR